MNWIATQTAERRRSPRARADHHALRRLGVRHVERSLGVLWRAWGCFKTCVLLERCMQWLWVILTPCFGIQIGCWNTKISFLSAKITKFCPILRSKLYRFWCFSAKSASVNPYFHYTILPYWIKDCILNLLLRPKPTAYLKMVHTQSLIKLSCAMFWTPL